MSSNLWRGLGVLFGIDIKKKLPEINEEDRTPLVDVLLEILAWQQKQIDKLEQEILKL
jgi:hypothetical protein